MRAYLGNTLRLEQLNHLKVATHAFNDFNLSYLFCNNNDLTRWEVSRQKDKDRPVLNGAVSLYGWSTKENKIESSVSKERSINLSVPDLAPLACVV